MWNQVEALYELSVIPRKHKVFLPWHKFMFLWCSDRQVLFLCPQNVDASESKWREASRGLRSRRKLTKAFRETPELAILSTTASTSFIRRRKLVFREWLSFHGRVYVLCVSRAAMSYWNVGGWFADDRCGYVPELTAQGGVCGSKCAKHRDLL